ncbi:hypothetical protein [Hymenobacter negativus]|uniref:EF-hand domain-containing protein n=1 Tax=Hymenobacter negativus TaxID=2795026 RepID=A0ABS3QPE6_9BACT|nr:hypothetical protein [Hymenobacter negativus]MBO2012982.1 hypothetical protein [Hymenobacter negativus]
MNFSVPVFLGLVCLVAKPYGLPPSGRGRPGPPLVSKAVVYTHFLPGGSTKGLAIAFHRPADYPGAVDTADLNRAGRVSGTDLSRLLAEAKRKKHYPMKIAGIRFAGQLAIAGGRMPFCTAPRCSST